MAEITCYRKVQLRKNLELYYLKYSKHCDSTVKYGPSTVNGCTHFSINHVIL